MRAPVLRAGRIVRLENRETLTFEGDTDTRMYGIVAGFIGCHISHRHNQPVLGTLLGPGEWFGEGPMVDASTRHITYCAMQPAQVLALDAAGMAELRVDVDGQFMYNQRSDGLSEATPTGSTA